MTSPLTPKPDPDSGAGSNADAPTQGNPRSYETSGVIGEGGMAVVYRARDLRLDREVAIKELRNTGDPRLRRLFLEEAKKMASVDHANVLPIHAVDPDPEGPPRLVMELAESCLADHLRTGPLDPAEVKKLSRHLLAGLRAIHEAGLVHRDLKPANIFYRKGLYKIGDFGIASSGEAQTQLFATPKYMAPEVLDRPHLVGPATDLYSLGLILYEASVGPRRFEQAMAQRVEEITGGSVGAGSTTRTWQTFHASEAEMPPPHRVDARVPEDLSSLVERLLRKDPRQRLQSCRQGMRVLEDPTAPPGTGPVAGDDATVLLDPGEDSESASGGRTVLLATAVGLGLLASLAIFLVAMQGDTVEIVSDPSGASVLVDGENVGVTPHEAMLSEDDLVEIRLGGYRTTSLRTADAVDGTLGGPLTWNEPVMIESRPTGATILRGNELLGETPYELLGQGAAMELELRLAGHRTRRVEVEPGSASRVVRLGRELPDVPEAVPSPERLPEILEPFLTPEADLELALADGARSLRFYDELRLEARSGEAGEAALFMIFSDGSAALLYPGESTDPLELEAGRTMPIPRPREQRIRALQVYAPAGIDRAYLLATTETLPPPPRGEAATWFQTYPWEAGGNGASSRELVRWAASVRRELGSASSLVVRDIPVEAP